MFERTRLLSLIFTAMRTEIGPSRYVRLRDHLLNPKVETCPHCQTKMSPPRDICLGCNENVEIKQNISGRGEVYSFTTVYEAPAGYEEQAPYTLALVKLEEGSFLTAQLTDLGDEEVKIGMPVEMVTRKLRKDGNKGILLYGYKFRPRLERSSTQ